MTGTQRRIRGREETVKQYFVPNPCSTLNRRFIAKTNFRYVWKIGNQVRETTKVKLISGFYVCAPLSMTDD